MPHTIAEQRLQAESALEPGPCQHRDDGGAERHAEDRLQCAEVIRRGRHSEVVRQAPKAKAGRKRVKTCAQPGAAVVVRHRQAEQGGDDERDGE